MRILKSYCNIIALYKCKISYSPVIYIHGSKIAHNFETNIKFYFTFLQDQVKLLTIRGAASDLVRFANAKSHNPRFPHLAYLQGFLNGTVGIWSDVISLSIQWKSTCVCCLETILYICVLFAEGVFAVCRQFVFTFFNICADAFKSFT